MGALTALRRTPRALITNPVILIPVLAIGLIQLPQLVAQSINPLLASVVSLGISGLFVLVMPFVQAGIIGMADEALAGHTRLETFVVAGRTHYIRVLVAYLLIFVVNMFLGIGLIVTAFIGGIFVLPHLQLSAIALGFFGLFLLLFIVGFLLVVFFIQFYAQAIVLDDEGAIDGIRRSIGLVRQNLLSTLGYSVFTGVIGGVFGLLLGAVSLITSPTPTPLFTLPALSLPAIALLALTVIVIGTVIGGFLAIYSVSFYRELSDLQIS